MKALFLTLIIIFAGCASSSGPSNSTSSKYPFEGTWKCFWGDTNQTWQIADNNGTLYGVIAEGGSQWHTTRTAIFIDTLTREVNGIPAINVATQFSFYFSGKLPGIEMDSVFLWEQIESGDTGTSVLSRSSGDTLFSGPYSWRWKRQ